MILLHEIKTANIAYHTYLLPEAKQLCLVLKGLPTNIPEDVREELATHNITTTHIFQLKKVDKTTQTAIITYPIFILTFPASTELQQILRINRLCHCVITWENIKTPAQFNSATTAKRLVIHQHTAVSNPTASNVINLILPKHAQSYQTHHPLASIVMEPTQQTLQVAPTTSNTSKIANAT